METPQQPNTTDADSNPKPRRRDFRFAKPAPPDHWIYQQGPQFGFVRVLPKSIKDLQSKAKEVDAEQKG